MARILEAYVGEYASGKSEVALNRALYLYHKGQRPVNLVDLDLVEPFFTLRAIKKELEAQGLTVLAWEQGSTFGFGETGTLLKPETRWVLKRQGDVIFDLGYGVAGAGKLRLIEIQRKTEKIKIYAVINIARPLTKDVQSIVEYIRSIGPVDGMINNSHLGDDTDVTFIQEAARIVREAAKSMKIPVIWTTVDERFRQRIKPSDTGGNKTLFIKRHMHRAFW